MKTILKLTIKPLFNLFILLGLFFSLISVLSYSLYSQIGDEEILQAMRDGIKRSMLELKIESLSDPYYIEYKLTLNNPTVIKSNMGSVSDISNKPYSRLNVQVRVGDYKFDNTNFFDIGLGFFGSSDDEERYKNRNIGQEFDYFSLRRHLWLATDAAYKQSAELFAKKISALKNRSRKDTTHDYLRMEAKKIYKKKEFPKFNKKYFIELAKSLSDVFNDYSDINSSEVLFENVNKNTYYVNSEGVEYIKSYFYTSMEIVAATQADDGMPLSNYDTYFARDPNNFPSKSELIRKVKDVADILSATKKSEFLEDSYSGPVLFTKNAAAELFAQNFNPNLVTQRKAISDGGFVGDETGKAFQSKIGGRVLPEFLSMSANPKIEKYNDEELVGYYNIDDNGIKSEEIELVKDGYLKNLLSSRIPTKRVRRSNGHKRGGSPMLSSVFITANKKSSVSYEDLKKRMIKLCKDRELKYGIVVKKIMNRNILYTTLYSQTMGEMIIPRGAGKFSPTEMYKVYVDGTEELIRGANGTGFTVRSFKDIILSGVDEYVHNYLAPAVVSPFVSGGDQYIPCSIIVPDLLFEDGELKTIENDFKKPPYISSPLVNH